jgi:hypothetical protein
MPLPAASCAKQQKSRNNQNSTPREEKEQKTGDSAAYQTASAASGFAVWVEAWRQHRLGSSPLLSQYMRFCAAV